MKKNPVEYGQARFGSVTKGAVEVANLAGNPIKITFTDFSKGFYINAVPDMIPEGGRTDLIFSIDTRAANAWGTAIFSATPVINGKKADKPIQVKATILEDFGNMSKEDMDNAALPMLSKSSYDFGKVKAGTIVKATFDLKNIGRSELIVHKSQFSENGIDATYKERIPAGSFGNFAVTINTQGMTGNKNLTITLITNSPTRPVVNLMISGEVTK